MHLGFLKGVSPFEQSDIYKFLWVALADKDIFPFQGNTWKKYASVYIMPQILTNCSCCI